MNSLKLNKIGGKIRALSLMLCVVFFQRKTAYVQIVSTSIISRIIAANWCYAYYVICVVATTFIHGLLKKSCNNGHFDYKIIPLR